jgi:hypothetical protein
VTEPVLYRVVIAPNPDPVVIEWVYHDAGNFWRCPICHESPGSGNNKPGLMESCKECSSTFVAIPDDVTGPNWSPKYGYFCTFRGTPLPKLCFGASNADDLRAAGWHVSEHFDNGCPNTNKTPGVSWRLSNGQQGRSVWAEAKTDKEALDEIRRKVRAFVHEDNLARKAETPK